MMETDEEVREYFDKKAGGKFYDAGIKKLPQRLKKCIKVNGDYVEK